MSNNNDNNDNMDGWSVSSSSNKRRAAKATSRPEPDPQVQVAKLSKKVCRFFEKGDCVKGKFCEYAHVAKLKAPPKPKTVTIARVTKTSLPSIDPAALVKAAKQKEKENEGSDFQHTPPETDKRGHGGMILIDDNPNELDVFSGVSHGAGTPNDHVESIDPVVVVAQSVAGPGAGASQSSITTSATTPNKTTTYPCRVFAGGGDCRFGEKCRFSHDPHLLKSRTGLAECGICLERILEKGQRFGLLLNCDHCFCLPCISSWRAEAEHQQALMVEQNLQPDKRVPAARSCPLCREFSAFVIPSLTFVSDHDEKQSLLDTFLGRRQVVRCQYWAKGECKFGNSCHYAHVSEDGQRHQFSRSIVGQEGAVSGSSIGRTTLSDFFNLPGSSDEPAAASGPPAPATLTDDSVDEIVRMNEKEIARINFENDLHH